MGHVYVSDLPRLFMPLSTSHHLIYNVLRDGKTRRQTRAFNSQLTDHFALPMTTRFVLTENEVLKTTPRSYELGPNTAIVGLESLRRDIREILPNGVVHQR